MLGIDLVYLPEFKIKLKSVQLGKIFLEIELAQNKSVESLAGIFAAKEAFFKATGRKGDWLSVWIEKNPPSLKASADAKAMADTSEGLIAIGQSKKALNRPLNTISQRVSENKLRGNGIICFQRANLPLPRRFFVR